MEKNFVEVIIFIITKIKQTLIGFGDVAFINFLFLFCNKLFFNSLSSSSEVSGSHNAGVNFDFSLII